MKSFTDALNWRYATKKFDTSKKLTDDQLKSLTDALRLAPSSYGLQPFHFVIVSDPAIRAKIREHAWNQPQVTDASHLIVLCARRSIDAAYVDSFIARIAKTRGMTAESLQSYREMMAGSIAGRTPENLADWMKRQAYIALGVVLSAAAVAGIDACPMEGFDPTHVDTDLGLAEQNLTAVALCPVGFRAADDATAAYAKVRMPLEEVVTFR
jgi:nitroreductase